MKKISNPSPSGLHLWGVSLSGPNHDTLLQVTTRSRNPVDAARKAVRAIKDSEELLVGNLVSKIKYKGTIDA